jgi:hypothetical protein
MSNEVRIVGEVCLRDGKPRPVYCDGRGRRFIVGNLGTRLYEDGPTADYEDEADPPLLEAGGSPGG